MNGPRLPSETVALEAGPLEEERDHANARAWPDGAGRWPGRSVACLEHHAGPGVVARWSVRGPRCRRGALGGGRAAGLRAVLPGPGGRRALRPGLPAAASDRAAVLVLLPGSGRLLPIRAALSAGLAAGDPDPEARPATSA